MADEEFVCQVNIRQYVHIIANRCKTRQSVTLKQIRTVYGYWVRVYSYILWLSLKSERNLVTMNPVGFTFNDNTQNSNYTIIVTVLVPQIV